MAKSEPIKVKVEGVFGAAKPTYGQDQDASDLYSDPDKNWPVQLFYGTQSERKFKDYNGEIPTQPGLVMANILYVTDQWALFRDGDLIRHYPLTEVRAVILFEPEAEA